MNSDRVLVVGSFGSSKSDGRQGGLAFACSSLINSELSQQFEFIKIDSTVDSIRDRSGLRRLPAAMLRVVRAAWHMLFGRVKYVICFSSHGNSFLEKGLIAMLGSLFGRRVLFFPRSGHIISQVQRRRWFCSYVEHTLSRSYRVICQSAFWQEFYSNLLSETRKPCEHLIVLENWLPDDAFVESSAKVASSAASMRFDVGFFNRIEVEKGIYDFLHAVKAAHVLDHRVHGVVHGDGSELERMQHWIEENGLSEIVEYRGWVAHEEKHRVLRKLDAIVFTSHAEGFPNSLLEVMAIKLPCIGTAVGAVNDLIEHGVSGLLVQPGDVCGLTSGIMRYCHDEKFRNTAAEQAFARVDERNRLAHAVRIMRGLLE
jgi:glycosyltransferase involved in cell wall biosynthesis